MSQIDKIEKVAGIRNIRNIKKNEVSDAFDDFLKMSPVSADKKDLSRGYTKDGESGSLEKKKLKPELKKISMMLDSAIKKFNEIFDKRKIRYYVFYDILPDNNILLNIADIKTGKYILQHIICLTSIAGENEFYHLIEDLISKNGLLIDLNA